MGVRNVTIPNWVTLYTHMTWLQQDNERKTETSIRITPFIGSGLKFFWSLTEVCHLVLDYRHCIANILLCEPFDEVLTQKVIRFSCHSSYIDIQ